MSATRSNPRLAAALGYAELGYPVFPCAPGTKVPITANGFHDASTDPAQIEKWCADTPAANIAIPTHGLMVIDIDGKDNPWLASAPERQVELAAGPMVLTPRGGRHHYFKQPAGKSFRNSEGLVAEAVDVRANGGYALVPPSAIDGKHYAYADGMEIDMPLDQLPEPPGWLVAELERVESERSKPALAASDGAIITEGRRNGTLARLAGGMRRVGMTGPEIAAALLRVNADRCQPPLVVREVEKIAASIARYPPDQVSVALAEDWYGRDRAGQDDEGPISACDLVARYPALRPPVVEKLIRRGETANMIASSKAQKTFTSLSLGMSICTGEPWLGMFPTTRGRILYIDNELHGETIAFRLPKVAGAMGIPMEHLRESFIVYRLRGRLKNLIDLGPFFDSLEPGEFDVIFLDAFYRFLPPEHDENDNAKMAALYNLLDAHAERLGCCFVIIHHTSKGAQGSKSVTDVGAGAGSQSRATDTHIVLRAHKEDGCVVLDAAMRSWPPFEPVCLRWEFPVWVPAPELKATDLKPDRAPKVKQPKSDAADKPAPPPLTAEQFTAKFVTANPEPVDAIVARASFADVSARGAERLLSLAVSEGKVHRWPGGNRQRDRFATVPPPAPETNDDEFTRARARTPPHPPVAAKAARGRGGARGEKKTKGKKTPPGAKPGGQPRKETP